MKNLFFLFTIFFMVSILTSCEEEEITPEVDENGLTREITDLVPELVLEEMIELGMPINGGVNPPNLEGEYLATPFVLRSSNIPADIPGSSFADLQFRFYGQKNEDLSLMLDYRSTGGNLTEEGIGLGSFIVGDDCSFSVFVKVDVNVNGDNAIAINVFSGNLVNDGIEDFHYANFVTEDFGDPNNNFIEVGEGRVIYDQDGYTPILGGQSAWYSKLPDCPCEYTENIDGQEEMCGEWINCGAASQDYHYGASFEIRWVPNEAGEPGQQCTYDANKMLITSGIAAGTPDKDSPDICGWGDILSGQGFPDIDHYFEDVRTWGNEPCYKYLTEWKPNSGDNCTSNPISDITHMRKMVGEMTCEEITIIIKSAEESPNSLINADLRTYILGDFTLQLTETQLIEKLRDWKNAQSSSSSPDENLSSLIDQAILNLQ